MSIEKDILMSTTKAKGKRPEFFEDNLVERVLSMNLALANELSVTQERLATLENLLQEKGALGEMDFDAYRPTKAQQIERAKRQQAMINRLLRLIHQDSQAISE